VSDIIFHERGRVGSLSRSRPSNDPELVEARQNLATAKLADYIDRVLAQAPPLSDEQRAKLAELLKPARTAAAKAIGDGDG
jgi:hypothetical protein